MDEELKRFMQGLSDELRALEKLGVAVPPGVFDRAADAAEIGELYETMNITNCVDLLISLDQVESVGACSPQAAPGEK